MKKSANWEWFSVKLIFQYQITGTPEPDTIDKNYTNQFTTYEESIVLIKAKSFNHAYKIAEKKAKDVEDQYINPYGESVKCKFIEAIDCFSIEEDLYSGLEVYSRFLRIPKNTDKDDFIDRYYPETIKSDDGLDYNFILRNQEFNKRPNS